MFSIADFNIDFESKYINTSIIFHDYVTDNSIAHLKIKCSDKEIFNENTEENLSYANLEFNACHRKIAEWLPNNESFVLHSACVDVNGVGVAFAAKSGTGKTTHMLLWKKLLDNNLKIVNGDKPIIRFFDDEPFPYAYGTPWNGKEAFGRNTKTPLKHICFIERSTTNFIESIKPQDAIKKIINQVYMPKEPVAMNKTIVLINRLIACCKLWVIHCNMELSAAEIAYNTIFNIK